jgi:hypothetical protein
MLGNRRAKKKIVLIVPPKKLNDNRRDPVGGIKTRQRENKVNQWNNQLLESNIMLQPPKTASLFWRKPYTA